MSATREAWRPWTSRLPTALVVGLSCGLLACSSAHEAKRDGVAEPDAAVHPRFDLTSPDLAVAADPQLAKNPHQVFQNLHVAANRAITLALQEQAAAFIASDGEHIGRPVPADHFEVPIHGPLPETLNDIR